MSQPPDGSQGSKAGAVADKTGNPLAVGDTVDFVKYGCKEFPSPAGSGEIKSISPKTGIIVIARDNKSSGESDVMRDGNQVVKTSAPVVSMNKERIAV